MRKSLEIAKDSCLITLVNDEKKLDELRTFLHAAEPYTIACDTETNSLNVMGPGFFVRLIQFGDDRISFVLPAELWSRATIRAIVKLAFSKGLIFHNAAFDILALESCGYTRLEDVDDSFHDTIPLSHLVDPRSRDSGGVGMRLEDLSKHYVCKNAAQPRLDLEASFKSQGYNKDEGWEHVEISDPAYVIYAGADVLYTARLHSILRSRVNAQKNGSLARFEHEVIKVAAYIRRTGLPVDESYFEPLQSWLEYENQDGIENARQWGVNNINSTKQVQNALYDLDWTPTEFTKKGAPKVDAAALDKIINAEEPAAPLARELKRAKRAGKWNTAYAEKTKNSLSIHGRIHPSIATIRARTSRMSVSDPPLQQLPSRGDDAWRIRRMITSKKGWLIGSADYDQIEFRVLAALADVAEMKYAIFNDIDLHDRTAELIWGPNFTKGQRTMGKGAGFGTVFGGGAATLARQVGITETEAANVIRDYRKVYPEVARFARQLKLESKLNGGFVYNYHGRYLPHDQGKEYALVNYCVQSIARDILAMAMVRAHKEGLTPYILLPLHDELLYEAPEDEIEDVNKRFSEIMTTEFIDVPITASGETYGRSWAEGYVYTDDQGVVRSKGTKNEITDWVVPA